MKKYGKLLMIAFMTAFFFSVSVYAEETAVEPEIIYPAALDEMPEDIPDPKADEIQAYSRAGNYNGTDTELYLELEERIREALLAGEPDVYVSDIGIDRAKYSIYRMVYYSPYLSNGINIGCYYSPSTNLFTRIEFNNPMSLQETKQHILGIDSAVAEVMQQATQEMDSETKALRIHDYFVHEYEYDYDNYKSNTLPDDSFRSGGIIKNKVGVCQAYAYAYMYMMNRMGIECYVTGSDMMNHAWNIIKLDGAYYHVDCTWDDPVPDKLGRVSHSFFLLSDSEMLANRHYGWDLTNLACDRGYKKDYWKDIKSQIIVEGNHAYYIKNAGNEGGIYSRSMTEDTENSMKTSLGKWEEWGNSSRFWTGAYSGLFFQNGRLYYNTSEKIWSISLDGSNDVPVSDKLDTADGYLYGSRRRGDQIEYLLSRSPNEDTPDIKMSIPFPDTILPTGILLSEKNLKVAVGKSKTLRCSLIPSGASAQIVWSSSNPEVASVDEKGTVAGVAAGGAGKATITADAGNGITAECVVTVSEEQYTVTYDANGGTAPVTSQTVGIGTVYGNMPVPSRTGYQFTGWYTNRNSGTKVTGSTDVRERNHTLYAHWTPITYTIRYHKNGATGGSMADTSCKYGTGYILRTNKFTKKGYTFSGWAASAGGAVIYKNESVVSNLANSNGAVKTLYAKWTPVKYKITYKLNSGKNSKKNPASYKITSSKITLKNPTRKGYTFKGWYSDKKFKKRVKSIAKGSTGNKTLYAKWAVNKYKITYKLNGGKNYKKNPKTYKVTSSTITLKKPARKGYTFKGWYSDKKYKKKVTKIKKGSTGNKVLYAKWKRKRS